jgi:hypothetical protein
VHTAKMVKTEQDNLITRACSGSPKLRAPADARCYEQPKINMNIDARITAESIIVHQYRYFYYLANELAYKAIVDRHDTNAFRYAVGTVIMSYTTIETYFNHMLFSEEYALRNLHEGMTNELKTRIERMRLPEKIEFALRFQPDAQQAFLNRGREPYQSFDLLRQMRNLLIHYVPERETVWSESGEHIDNVKKLEKKLSGRFQFMSPAEIKLGDPTTAFLYRLFNRECAKWSFECVAPFIDALSKAFQVPAGPLEKHWGLN